MNSGPLGKAKALPGAAAPDGVPSNCVDPIQQSAAIARATLQTCTPVGPHASNTYPAAEAPASPPRLKSP